MVKITEEITPISSELLNKIQKSNELRAKYDYTVQSAIRQWYIKSVFKKAFHLEYKLISPMFDPGIEKISEVCNDSGINFYYRADMVSRSNIVRYVVLVRTTEDLMALKLVQDRFHEKEEA